MSDPAGFLTGSPASRALRLAAVGGGEALCPVPAALLRAAADEIDALRDALHWCGGSPSFQEGGEAEEGWRRIVEPLFGPAP